MIWKSKIRGLRKWACSVRLFLQRKYTYTQRRYTDLPIWFSNLVTSCNFIFNWKTHTIYGLTIDSLDTLRILFIHHEIVKLIFVWIGSLNINNFPLHHVKNTHMFFSSQRNTIIPVILSKKFIKITFFFEIVFIETCT